MPHVSAVATSTDRAFSKCITQVKQEKKKSFLCHGLTDVSVMAQCYKFCVVPLLFMHVRQSILKFKEAF